MKYLLPFNESIIRIYEFEESITRENLENFDITDYNRIVKCVSSCRTFDTKYNYITKISDYPKSILITNIASSGRVIKIYKCKDEWYYINNRDMNYYKCDQIDSLLLTLKRFNYQFDMYKNYIPGRYR